ncbi:hypothetical protein DVDV_2633 [Desulfovibrio sp. DV]|uniref:hypothetical protein n=1 Tax=Desulfovibrio sp. DV TaxID=1844708 RepID=UPI00094B7F7E|nr:hypothetical protein [Desulfovibrio sp. DV]OLN26505.1 hypothetical protein DVDV_2633 [Desulfovibrio sp. DV]
MPVPRRDSLLPLTWVLFCCLLLPGPALADDALLPLFIPSITVPLSRDTDGDGLPDVWERNGYHVGNTFVDLPGMGADPMHKDLFVWMDYMIHPTKGSLGPSQTVIDNITAVFANAPVANPDGTTGIRIHPLLKNSVSYAETLGVADNYTQVWVDFEARKSLSFDPAYAKSFRYMIWANSYNADSSSGLARDIPATDFLVSLGLWGLTGGTDWEKLGTFVHELGHCLGLTHGGADHENYKPNYLSVMNYSFQIGGLYKDGHWGDGGYPLAFDYQRLATPTLNEAALNENLGLTGADSVAGYGTYYYYDNGLQGALAGDAAAPIDWNHNGSIEANVSADINGDGAITSLVAQNNWANINYNAGGLLGPGATAAARATADSRPMPDELRRELDLETSRRLSQSRPQAATP